MRQELVFALSALLSLSSVVAQGTAQITGSATLPASRQPTGFVTSTATAAVQTIALTPENGGPGVDTSTGSGGVDTLAGASGQDTGAAGLTRGGVIGLGVGIGVVVLFIVPLTILFVIAKKRGWEARKSFRRASRRLTGKFESAKSRRQSRTQGVRMDSPRRTNNLEKGKSTTTTTVKATKKEVAETPKISKFELESPVAKSWKSKLAGR